jgi:hypothetical protein
VIAIEPSASTFARSDTVLKQHGVDDRSTCIHAALGPADGTTIIATGYGTAPLER